MPANTPHEETLHTCPYCGERFEDEQVLRQHLAHEHGDKSNTPTYRCEICGADFDTESRLEQHTASAHQRAGTL